MKFGLKPFKKDPRDFSYLKYRFGPPLPKHPKAFGHENLIAEGKWGMLGNADRGDCVWAGAAHETMLWNAMAGKPVPEFNDECVLSDYSAVTGFDPNNPDATDNGTDMREAMKYRQNVGIVDASGTRHKIGAYVWLPVGNFEMFLEATWLMGACPIGIQVPRSAMDQFNSGHPWDKTIFNNEIEGGHYIPGVSMRSYAQIVTWARLQNMTKAFYLKYCNAACAVISEEMLASGKSPEGFDLAALMVDLKRLN